MSDNKVRFKTEEYELLRNRILTECRRRNCYGSLEEFAGPPLSLPPLPGEIISASQGREIIDPLLQIKDFEDLCLVKKGDRIPSAFDAAKLTELIELYENEPMEGETSSCRGACTGLCVGTCGNGCNGCSGSCGGGCAGGCEKSCSGTCTASCGSGCAGGCMVSTA